MTKIRHAYKDCHILDLNMMSVRDFKPRKSKRIAQWEGLFVLLPLLVLAGYMAVSFAPEMTFFAQCQNIPGGDICAITLGR